MLLYASKTEINKNKTQIHTTRSIPCSNCPSLIIKLSHVGTTLRTLRYREQLNIFENNIYWSTDKSKYNKFMILLNFDLIFLLLIWILIYTFQLKSDIKCLSNFVLGNSLAIDPSPFILRILQLLPCVMDAPLDILNLPQLEPLNIEHLDINLDLLDTIKWVFWISKFRKYYGRHVYKWESRMEREEEKRR